MTEMKQMAKSTSASSAPAALADAELAAHAASGDAAAFRLIMERNNGRLYRVARAVLRNDSEAEDVVQGPTFAPSASFPRFAPRHRFPPGSRGSP